MAERLGKVSRAKKGSVLKRLSRLVSQPSVCFCFFNLRANIHSVQYVAAAAAEQRPENDSKSENAENISQFSQNSRLKRRQKW